MSNSAFPSARKDGLSVQTIGDEVLLYDGKHDTAHVLNPTSALVWQLANGKRSIQGISQAVAHELHSAPDEDLIWLALAQLSKAGLLAEPVTMPIPLAGMKRREFLQKAALAAMVVPVVKTIHSVGNQAPVSCKANGASCTSPTECCSGICAGTCQPPSPDCFLPGTPVLYHDGTRRPIENVQIGDMVLAREEKTGMIAPQAVTQTFIHTVENSFWLDVNGDKIGSTPVHPFYTGGSWVRADQLRAGMDCVLEDGSYATVQSIEPLRAHSHIVHNLAVAGYHTFFVGERGVWVHNKG